MKNLVCVSMGLILSRENLFLKKKLQIHPLFWTMIEIATRKLLQRSTCAARWNIKNELELFSGISEISSLFECIFFALCEFLAISKAFNIKKLQSSRKQETVSFKNTLDFCLENIEKNVTKNNQKFHKKTFRRFQKIQCGKASFLNESSVKTKLIYIESITICSSLWLNFHNSSFFISYNHTWENIRHKNPECLVSLYPSQELVAKRQLVV